jgi:hypothetical protein
MAEPTTIMMAVSAASQAAGALQALQQGRSQAAMYELQGEMALAKSQRDAVNAEIQANDVLRKLRQTNSAAIARGFAGGVSGFSGSAKLVQEVNEQYAGRDFKNLQVAAKEKRSFGEIQKMMFEEAADAAVSSSRFDAFTKLASAAATTYSLMPGGAPGGGASVPGFENAGKQFADMKTYAASGGPTSMFETSLFDFGSTQYWKGM